MGQMKHIHHEEIVKRNKPDNPAAEEYYSEQKRQERNKERQERLKNVPVAAPVEIIFEGRRHFPSDPKTDAQRFEQGCREADKEAKKTGDSIAVFKNSEGNYFTWEEKYISPANPIEVLYMAYPPAPKENK